MIVEDDMRVTAKIVRGYGSSLTRNKRKKGYGSRLCELGNVNGGLQK